MSGDAPRRLHPATVLLNVVRSAPGFILGIPAFLAFVRDVELWVAGLTALGLGVVVALFQYLGWRRFTYRLTDDAVVIESGILGRNRRTIPFDRVQDVDIERKLLARLFGLAKVHLETGGAGANEGALDSVSAAEAERLRGVIRRRAAEAHGATADAPDAGEGAERAAGPAPLFAMSLGRVLYSGLFRFSLVWLAVIGTALQYVENWLPFQIGDEAAWRELGSRADATVHAARTAWIAGAVATLLLLVLALGVVAGVLRTLARDYGFTLTDEGGRYRRVRGLLTRSEAVIALRRVQLALIEDGLVTRLLGWAGLRLQTLGGGAKSEGGRHEVAPFARSAEIDRVLAPLSFERADPKRLTRVSSRHVWRMLILRLGWLAVPIAAIAIARANVAEAALLLGGLLILFVLIALSVAVVVLLQRGHHRYGIEGATLHVQRGVLGRRRWILPAANVQAITVRRSWLQRRLGTASVHPDTAGASMLSTPAIEDVRPDQAWTLVDALRSFGKASAGAG